MKNLAIGTLLCLAAAPLAAPLAAQTACPTAADLARGIRIDFADGSHEISRSGAPGVVRVQAADAAGLEYEMELGQGFHLLMFQTLTNGAPDQSSRLTYDYGMVPSAMPQPVAGQGWQTPVTVTAVDGTRSEPQKHAYGPLEPLQIGSCTYQAMVTTIAYATSDHYSEGVVYLPELGTSYLIWNESDTIEKAPVPAIGISVLTK